MNEQHFNMDGFYKIRGDELLVLLMLAEHKDVSTAIQIKNMIFLRGEMKQ